MSSLHDLIYWVLVSDGKLLKPASVSLMLTPKKLNDGSTGKFGYGWFAEVEKPGITYHSGHTPGFAAFVYRNRQKRTAIVLLFNNDGIPTPELLTFAKELDRRY